MTGLADEPATDMTFVWCGSRVCLTFESARDPMVCCAHAKKSEKSARAQQRALRFDPLKVRQVRQRTKKA